MNTTKKILLYGTLLTFSSISFAQMNQHGRLEGDIQPNIFASRGDKIPFMGILGGSSNPIGGLNPTAEMALTAGYQPESGIGYGAEVSTTQLDDTDHTQRTTIMGQGAYKIGGDIPFVKYSYVAIGAGPAFAKSEVELAIGPAIGIDYPVNNRVHEAVTVGLNAKYVGVSNSPDSYIGSAAVKYWY